MLKKVCWVVLAIFFMAVCLCFSSSEEDHTLPTPPDVKIELPDSSLPAEVKSLLGKWVGQWKHWRPGSYDWDAVLYVEKVEKDSARVICAWGEYKHADWQTSAKSCHCDPNWVRIQNAKIKYSDRSSMLEFYTPGLRNYAWLLERSHTVTGSVDEVFGVYGGSRGRFAYQFIVDKDAPTVMKGEVISVRGRHFSVKMKKVEQDKKSE